LLSQETAGRCYAGDPIVIRPGLRLQVEGR
jgi:hypothetical protein